VRGINAHQKGKGLIKVNVLEREKRRQGKPSGGVVACVEGLLGNRGWGRKNRWYLGEKKKYVSMTGGERPYIGETFALLEGERKKLTGVYHSNQREDLGTGTKCDLSHEPGPQKKKKRKHNRSNWKKRGKKKWPRNPCRSNQRGKEGSRGKLGNKLTKIGEQRKRGGG